MNPFICRPTAKAFSFQSKFTSFNCNFKLNLIRCLHNTDLMLAIGCAQSGTRLSSLPLPATHSILAFYPKAQWWQPGFEPSTCRLCVPLSCAVHTAAMPPVRSSTSRGQHYARLTGADEQKLLKPHAACQAVRLNTTQPPHPTADIQ